MTYEPNPSPYAPPPASTSYAPPPGSAPYAPPPPQAARRSPVLGYVALGIAVLNFIVGIGGQIIQRNLLLQSHYSAAGYGLVSGVFTTIGILLDVAAVAVAIVAIIGRRGVIPAAVALGASAAGLLSSLGFLLISLTMSF